MEELPRREKRIVRGAAWRSYRKNRRNAGNDIDDGEIMEATLVDIKEQYATGQLFGGAGEALAEGQRFPWEIVLRFLEQLIDNMCPPE